MKDKWDPIAERPFSSSDDAPARWLVTVRFLDNLRQGAYRTEVIVTDEDGNGLRYGRTFTGEAWDLAESLYDDLCYGWARTAWNHNAYLRALRESGPCETYKPMTHEEHVALHERLAGRQGMPDVGVMTETV